MDTMLVRLKPYDPRRGFVLRRFTYAGIKFHEERGWYRVDKAVADYLCTVHESPDRDFTPLAFDVCTEEEAKAIDAREESESRVRRTPSEAVSFTAARAPGAVTSGDLAAFATGAKAQDARPKKG
jgi:hypothetical protein